MANPFVNYNAPTTGAQKLLTIDDPSVKLLHGMDSNGNFHFDIVDVNTNEIIRKATPVEVREAGLNPTLYLNAFIVEEPVDPEVPEEGGGL